MSDAHTGFRPLSLRTCVLRNRVVMSPMCQHSALDDGCATKTHVEHYAARGAGGVGLIMVEDTAVFPNGRLSQRALGLWDDAQVRPLSRVVDACHGTGAAIGVQIGHAGCRAFASRGDRPAGVGLVAVAEDGSFGRGSAGLDATTLTTWFVAAAKRAAAAGVDALEIHVAHGYLLHEILVRSDAGVDVVSAILRRVADAVRDSLELLVRISAGGPPDGQLRTQAFMDEIVDTVDVVDVSSGGGAAPIGSSQDEALTMARSLRNRFCTVSNGGVVVPDDVHDRIRRGDSHLVGVGRALLLDPEWLRIGEVPLNAAESQSPRLAETDQPPKERLT